MVHWNWEFLPRTCKHLSSFRIVAICCHFNLHSYSQHTGDYWKLLEITGDYEKLLEIIYRLLEITRDYCRLPEINTFRKLLRVSWRHGSTLSLIPHSLSLSLSHLFHSSHSPLFLTHLCHNLHDNFSHNHMLSVYLSGAEQESPTTSTSTLCRAEGRVSVRGRATRQLAPKLNYWPWLDYVVSWQQVR